MAQVKKAEVRDAILDAAFQLFSEKDYASTTIAQIARRAGVSQGNIYVYFASKLDILWAVISPWLYRQVELLDLELARIPDPHARVERMLLAIWGEIPAADNNLAVNLVQGLALSRPGDNYSRDLLRFLESRLTRMLRDCLPPERWPMLEGDDALAHLVFMAFDGFVLGARVKGRSDRLAQTARLTADMILGTVSPAPPAGTRQQEAAAEKGV